jgi:ribosomal protein L11 methyltransferase
MPWIQLTFHTDKHHSEQAEQALLDLGALSVTLKDAEDQPVLEPLPGETPLWDQIILTGLFDADIDSQAIGEQLQQTLRQLQPGASNNSAIKIEALEDKDWVRAWMDDYKPMQFGERLWVCPRHLPPPQPDAVNLMLDPGLAFGTGTHPTTALCLQWLDQQPPQDKSVLDFGCGSGVLAIAALLLGAKHADATDIDPQALSATQSNAEANQVADKINTYAVQELPDEQYDIVLANILAGPLQELAPQLAAHCKSGGNIVLSGILETQAEKIIQAYSPWFELEPVAIKDEWIRVSGQKK